MIPAAVSSGGRPFTVGHDAFPVLYEGREGTDCRSRTAPACVLTCCQGGWQSY
ncbi:hypothetical protein SXCC_04388 [Gluconacetobacter sp. SXCC-1]|nr:hypothetical protein SXCC_04388 [Gluconacetobacter sp. SXCC-1]